MDTQSNSPIPESTNPAGIPSVPPTVSMSQIPPVPPTLPDDEPAKSNKGIIIGSAAGAAALAAAGLVIAWKGGDNGAEVIFEGGQNVAQNLPPVPPVAPEHSVVHHHDHYTYNEVHNETVNVVTEPEVGPTPPPVIEGPVEDFAVFVDEDGNVAQVAYFRLDDGTHAFIVDYDGDGVADLAIVDPTGTDTFEQTAFEWFEEDVIPMETLAEGFYNETGINPYEYPMPMEIFNEFANTAIVNLADNDVTAMGEDEVVPVDGGDDNDDNDGEDHDGETGIHAIEETTPIDYIEPTGEEELLVDPEFPAIEEEPAAIVETEEEAIVATEEPEPMPEPEVEINVTEENIEVEPMPEPYEPEPEPYEPEPEPIGSEPIGSEPEPDMFDDTTTDFDNIDDVG